MMVFFAALALVGAVLFGGGTRSGFAGDVVVQLVAVPLILLALARLLEDRATARAALLTSARDGARDARSTHAQHTRHVLERWRASLGLLLALAALAIVQLAPLGSWLLGDLAQRLSLTAASQTGTDAWRQVSLTPHATWSGLVSLVVPVAIFLAVAQIGERSRVFLVKVVIAVSAVSLVVGLLQVAQGPDSRLRFFEFTNTQEAVGFFANRNHFAALMYLTLVFATTWLVAKFSDGFSLRAPMSDAVLRAALGFGLVVAIVAALAMARSRAGMLLTMVAVLGLVILIRRSVRTAGSGTNEISAAGRFAAVTLGFAVLFAVQFGLHRMMTRFGADPLEDLRVPLTVTTLEAAWRSFPFGTGIGSFVPVFAVVEKPTELASAFANRAHNDYAEWLLETGAVGVVLMVMAAVWFVRRGRVVWRTHEHVSEHLLAQRAATLVIVLLLAHSLVDYPLRTTALVSVFALACALLLPARHDAGDDEATVHTRGGHESDLEKAQRSSEYNQGVREGSRDRRSDRPVRPHRTWGEQVEWPDAWRNPSKELPKKD